MTKVIIFKEDDGGVSVIHPTLEFLELYGIEAIALKEVPHNKPFKILDIEELPLDGTLNEYGIPNIDKTFRAQWDVDDADLTDGVGSESNEFEPIEDLQAVDLASEVENGD